MHVQLSANTAWNTPPVDAAGYKQTECGLYVPTELADQLRRINLPEVERYTLYLKNTGKAAATVQKYCHDIRSFVMFLGDRYLSVGLVREWLERQKQTRHVSTVNNAISALNGLFRWLGRSDCTVSFYRRQEAPYREDARNLEKADYLRLLRAADERMKAILQCFYGTGIRVSELRFFTVEAVQAGCVYVDNKGKVRTVFLDPGTKEMLRRYCRKKEIRSGVIFRGRQGGPLSRFWLWRAMKALARRAGVELKKVFPHNLRHLFAVERYKEDKDIECLRLELGHSMIATTQRYLKETAAAHFARVQRRGIRLTE